MSPARQPEIVVDLLQILLRHRIKMILVFLMVVGLAVSYGYVTKRLYTSEAKLFVRLGRETIGIDPSATTNQVVSVQDSRENEINSVLQLLQSEAIAAQVVDAIKPDVILEKQPATWLTPIVAAVDPVHVDSPRDLAILKFQKRLKVSAAERNSVITITYQSYSPELSRKVLEAMLGAARKEHLRVNQIVGSDKFFAEQSEKAHRQLARLEQEFLDLKHETGVSNFDLQRNIVVNRAATLKSSLLDAETQRSAAEAQIAQQESDLAGEPEQLVLAKVSGMPNSASQEMRQQLYTVQLKEKELLAKYTPQHALVKRVREQIDAAKRTLSDEHALTQVTAGVNSARQELHVALLTQKSTVTNLKARCANLQDQLKAAELEIAKLNSYEPRFNQFTRELDLLRSTYLSYSQKYEQARVDRALNSDSISNINILQEPSRSLLPSWPQPLLNVALGIALGLFCSMLVAMIAEYRRPAVM